MVLVYITGGAGHKQSKVNGQLTSKKDIAHWLSLPANKHYDIVVQPRATKETEVLLVMGGAPSASALKAAPEGVKEMTWAKFAKKYAPALAKEHVDAEEEAPKPKKRAPKKAPAAKKGKKKATPKKRKRVAGRGTGVEDAVADADADAEDNAEEAEAAPRARTRAGAANTAESIVHRQKKTVRAAGADAAAVAPKARGRPRKAAAAAAAAEAPAKAPKKRAAKTAVAAEEPAPVKKATRSRKAAAAPAAAEAPVAAPKKATKKKAAVAAKAPAQGRVPKQVKLGEQVFTRAVMSEWVDRVAEGSSLVELIQRTKAASGTKVDMGKDGGWAKWHIKLTGTQLADAGDATSVRVLGQLEKDTTPVPLFYADKNGYVVSGADADAIFVSE